MKKISFMPLLFASSLFSMFDAIIDTQKKDSSDNPPLSWLDKADKLRSLYTSLSPEKDNIENIEAIKTFHKNHRIEYHDYRYGYCPLECALKSGESDFVLFLLQEKKIDPKKISSQDSYALDYFVRGIRDSTFIDQQSEVLTLLIKNGCEINALNRYRRTPLAEYFFNIITVNLNNRYTNKKKMLLNPQLINSLFDHGARILCNPCNALHTIIGRSGNDCLSSYDTFTTITTLFKARLKQLSKIYGDRLLIFYALNKLRTKNKMSKIPKPLIHHLINIAMQHEDALCDTKESVSHKQVTDVSVKDCSNYRYEEVTRYKTVQKELTPCGVIKHSKRLSEKAALLIQLLTPTFWNRSLKECLQEFGSLIDTAHKKEEESKDWLENLFKKRKKEEKIWVN